MTEQWGDRDKDGVVAVMGQISADLGAYVGGHLAWLNGDRQAGFTQEREAELAESLAALADGIGQRAKARKDAEAAHRRPILRVLIEAAGEGGWVSRGDLAEACGGDTTAFRFAVDDMIRGDLVETRRETFRRDGPPPRTFCRVTDTGRKYFGVDELPSPETGPR